MGLINFLHWLNEHEEDQEKRILDALSKIPKSDFEKLTDEQIVIELERLIIKGSNRPKMSDIKKAG